MITAIAVLIGFVLGIVVMIAFNIFWPAKIDKASQELSDAVHKDK